MKRYKWVMGIGYWYSGTGTLNFLKCPMCKRLLELKIEESEAYYECRECGLYLPEVIEEAEKLQRRWGQS